MPPRSPNCSRARWLLVGLLGLVFWTSACGSGAEEKTYELPGSTDYIVREIVIKGVENFDVDNIKEGLATQEDPGWRTSIGWMPLLGAEHNYYNYVEWERDKQRIVTYYKARGYFDARIESESFVQNDEEKWVRLTINVFEGKPTMVTTVQFAGLQGTELTPQELKKTLSIKEGQRFVESQYTSSKEELATTLERRSYAYASVRGRVLVDPRSRKARITYFIDSGPASEFGEVKVQGLDQVDEEHVRRAATIQPGEPYDPRVMQESQEALYDLRVFSLVKVSTEYELAEFESFGEEEKPEEEEESEALGISELIAEAQSEAEERTELDPIVPIVIRVKESPPWNLRLGVSAEAEINRQALQGLLNWSNPNIFGTFWRVEQFNSVGYAWAPSFFDPLNDGVIASSELRLTRPQFLERLTTFKSRIKFEREVFEGYDLVSPSLRVGLERTFFDHLHLEVSYNFELNRLTSVDPSFVATDVFISDYILEYLEQRIRLDYRDEVLNPKEGWQLELTLNEAFGYLTLGESRYLKAIFGGEFYIPFDFGILQVLGFRARVGSIYNLDTKSEIPVPEKIYAGGIDSMRSFGRRQISFWTQRGQALEIGATSKLELSVEHRLRLSKNFLDVGELWGALFVDAASVGLGQLYANTGSNERGFTTIPKLADTLLYGVGGGVFWLTPVGPIRFDLAFTLSDTANDPRFRRCATDELVCDPEDRVPLDEDPIQDRISGFNFYIGIGHSF